MSTQMTPTQRNYAVARINAIANDMIPAITKQFVKEETKSITIGELVKLILKGKIKPKQKNTHKSYGGQYNRCARLDEAFEIVDPSSYYRTSPVRDEVKMKAALIVVSAKATAIKDKLMLGDAATALKMVADFETEAAVLTKKGR